MENLQQTQESLHLSTRGAWVPRSYFPENGLTSFYYATTIDLTGNHLQNSNSFLPKDIVLVVDCSGSMCNAMSDVHDMVRCVAMSLSPEDRLSIVSFEGEADVLLGLKQIASVDDPDLIQAIQGLQARGSTNIEAGLMMGVQVLSDQSEMVLPDQSEMVLPEMVLPDQSEMVLPDQSEMDVVEQSEMVLPDQSEMVLPDQSEKILPDQSEMVLPDQSEKIPVDRLAFLMLLSDGAATDGIKNAEELSRILKEEINKKISKTRCHVIIHSFGFTQSHDSAILSGVTSAGNFDVGMYYYIQEKKDIKPAIGDCLGQFSSISAYDISLNAVITPSVPIPTTGTNSGIMTTGISGIPISGIQTSGIPISGTPTISWKCCFLTNGTNISAQPQTANQGVISPKQKQTFILLCWTDSVPRGTIPLLEEEDQSTDYIPQIPDFEFPAIRLDIHFRETNRNWGRKFSEISISRENSSELDFLHVSTHIMRMSVAFALTRVLDPGARSIIPELEILHELLLQVLGRTQLVENELMIEDEGLLVELERDLGAAIERLEDHGSLPARLHARFLQFAHEHQFQKSASTGSHVRGTYSTSGQNAMRTRFLHGGDFEEIAIEEKVSYPLEEPGLTEEEISKRKEMEEETCYVSMENWRGTTLGIGLLVRPRTTRERRKKLMPVIELVEDYICADSYNSGVRIIFSNQTPNLDRENEEEEETHLAVKSSSRSRINAWLPLYVNSLNWKYSRSWAPSAFSIIATQFNDMFKPIHALKVCAKLMIQSVVKFTIQDERMSERAIQMYCDVHRLFLAMSEEYPDIVVEAEQALQNFIENPLSRNRKNTPDLGDLIQYLTITKKYTWDDIKEPYIIEAVRRNTLHIGHVLLTEIQNGVDGILQFWEQNTNSGKVTTFNVLFMKVVTPANLSIKEITLMYDQRWGRLSDTGLTQLKQGFTNIMNIKSVQEVFQYIGIDCSRAAIAELILWGFENTFDTSPGLKYLPKGMPSGAELFVQMWRERIKLLEWSRKEPPKVLEFFPPTRVRGKRGFSGISETVCLVGNKELDWETQPSPELPPSKKSCHLQRFLNHQLSSTPSNDSCIIFIGRLSRQTTEDQISAVLSQVVPIRSVKIIRNHKGKSNKYAFVELASPTDVALLVKTYWIPGDDGEKKGCASLKIGNCTAIIDFERGLKQTSN